MYFSFRGERKVPKESPLKESTQVLSLRILSPVRRALLPGGKRALCAVTSRVAGCPQPRRSAELAGFPRSRGCATSLLFLLRVSGEMSADGAPPFVRALCCPRPSAQSDPFAPTRAKGSRTQVVGSVREAPWGPPLRGALLVLFSRQGEKSTYINLPDKPKFIRKTPLHRDAEAFFRNPRVFDPRGMESGKLADPYLVNRRYRQNNRRRPFQNPP